MLFLCLLSGLSSSYAATPAGEQEQDHDATPTSKQPQDHKKPIELPEVKVTEDQYGTKGFVAINDIMATKTNTPILETPQSISVVTRKQMDAQGVTSVAEALRYTSGVQSEIRGASNDGSPYLFSRGFYLDELVDGMRMPSGVSYGYAVPNFDPYGMERIDVIKGPSSILFGQADPGGIANLVSKMPTDQPLHEIFVSAGNHGTTQAGFDLGGRLNSDGTLTYRLTGTGYYSDTDIDHARRQRYYIAPAITWRPDENTSLTLLAKYQYDPDAGYYNFVPAVGSLMDAPNGRRIPTDRYLGDTDFDHHRRTQVAVGYKFEHHFNSHWTFRQNFNYSYVRDNLADAFAYGYASPADTRLNRYSFTNHEHAKFFVLDNHAQADFSTGPVKHTVLAGVDYLRVLYRETVGSQFFTAPLDVYSPSYGVGIQDPAVNSDDHYQRRQIGAYMQDQMAYEKWRFLASIREDWSKTSDANPHERQENGKDKQSQSPHAFTWRSGLLYLFGNGLTPYFSYATSFNPQSGRSYNNGNPPRVTRPTTAQQYEVGLKYQPVGFNSFISLAAFQLKERNVLSPDLRFGNGAYSPYSIVSGEVRVRGVELEGHASLTNHLNAILTYTYLDDITTHSTATANVTKHGVNTGEITPMQGKTPWGIPKHMASGWLDYTFSDGALRGFGGGGGVRYTAHTLDESNTLRIPAQTQIDAMVHYELDPHWHFAINGKNLFNHRYVASCQSAYTCTYGDGREVLATARYRW